jgi:hypothetical protein
MEASLSCHKTAYVKFGASIDFEVRAMHTGYVSAVFKYMDSSNYYSFEIGGGDDVSSRYYQFRKKVNGTYKLLKRYATQRELPNVTFFGYEVNVWYRIRVLIKGSTFYFYLSIVNSSSMVFLFKITDTSFNEGKVCFGSYNTEVAIGNIDVKPILLDYSKHKI